MASSHTLACNSRLGQTFPMKLAKLPPGDRLRGVLGVVMLSNAVREPVLVSTCSSPNLTNAMPGTKPTTAAPSTGSTPTEAVPRWSACVTPPKVAGSLDGIKAVPSPQTEDTSLGATKSVFRGSSGQPQGPPEDGFLALLAKAELSPITARSVEQGKAAPAERAEQDEAAHGEQLAEPTPPVAPPLSTAGATQYTDQQYSERPQPAAPKPAKAAELPAIGEQLAEPTPPVAPPLSTAGATQYTDQQYSERPQPAAPKPAKAAELLGAATDSQRIKKPKPKVKPLDPAKSSKAKSSLDTPKSKTKSPKPLETPKSKTASGGSSSNQGGGAAKAKAKATTKVPASIKEEGDEDTSDAEGHAEGGPKSKRGGMKKSKSFKESHHRRVY